MSDKNDKPAKGYWESFTDWVGDLYEDSRNFLCEKDWMHEWNAWKYIQEDNCEQTRTCKRCSREDKRIAPHMFGKKQYRSPNSCKMEKTCLRCQYKKFIEIKHQWGKWGPSEKKKTHVFYVNRLRETYQTLKIHRQDDIKHLCKYLQIDFDNLKGETKSEKIIELVSICAINKRMDELLKAIPISIDGLKKETLKRLEEIENDLSDYAQSIHDTKFLWDFDPRLSCLEDRKCLRCKHIESRENHIWGPEEYISEDSCFRIQYCQSCGKSNKATKGAHEWGDWKYTYPHKCYMYKKCERCKERTESDKEFHTWHEKRDRNNPCLITKYCTRCGKTKTIAEEHRWEPESRNPNSCKKIEKCLVCRKKRFSEYEHSWGPWVPLIGQTSSPSSSERICNVCGKRETRTT